MPQSEADQLDIVDNDVATLDINELANILDISYQALSERLRRAHANLIDRMITPTELETEPSTKPR